MEEITNRELFEHLYNEIASGMSLRDVIKEYGGCSYYIPSFKRTHRNDEIREEYRKGVTVHELSQKHGLSKRQIQEITKEVRDERMME